MKNTLNQTPKMEQVLVQKHRDLEIYQSVPISRITVDVPLPPVVQSNLSCAQCAHVMFILLSNLHIMLKSEKCAM